MYFDRYPAHWAGMLVGTVAMIVFSIAMIWAVAWTVAIVMQHRSPPTPRDSDAQAILKRRYAAGEPDAAAYVRRREVLHGSP